MSRSALIRDALREHLHRLEIRELEEKDRAGYARLPQKETEPQAWEAEVMWAEE